MSRIETAIDQESLMQQAIDLAERGRGFVEPNPMVGCLIIKDSRIIGQGFHQEFGGPHAEVNALNSCQESPAGATAIVSLEPCCHHGKTPPCAEALIEAGITKVVVGLQDPNPRVDGGGIARLKAANVEVQSGLLASKVALQNAGFVKRVRTGKPWVIAKYAMTMDGKISTLTGDSKWISNEKSRERVHQLRSIVDAIVVGSGTVLEDDPSLTARPQNAFGPRTPLRVVVDSAAKTNVSTQLARTANETPTLLVYDPRKASPERVSELSKAGIEMFPIEEGYTSRIEFLLLELGKRQVTNLMVEGGGGTLGEFLAADQLDELRVFIAPLLIGAGRPSFAFPELSKMSEGRKFKLLDVEELDENIYVRGLVNQKILSCSD